MVLVCIPVCEFSLWAVRFSIVAEDDVPTAAVVGDVEEEDGAHFPRGPIHTPPLHSILWDDNEKTVPSTEHGMPSVRFAWLVTSVWGCPVSEFVACRHPLVCFVKYGLLCIKKESVLHTL